MAVTPSTAPEVTDLVTQLGRGLAAYRLFPGELERPAFATAVDRIRAAAELALRTGPVHVEVRAGRFQDDAGPLLEETALSRALFERRIERLLIVAPPAAAELAIFYGALDAADDVALDELLEAAEVRSIGVGAVAPRAAGVDEPDDGRTADERARARLLADARAHAEILMELSPQGSDAVVEWILRQEERAPTDVDARGQLRQAIALLPDDVRRTIGTRLVERARGGDERSGSWVTGMTDAELAQALLGVAGDRDEDAVSLARDYVERGERSSSLIGLTLSSAAGDDPFAAIRDRAALVTLEATPGDVSALDTLRTYVSYEEDGARLHAVLLTWAGEVRAALDDRDADLVGSLVGALDGLAEEQYRSALESSIDAGTVRSLLPEKGGADVSELVPLLRPLGGAAVDRVFAVLAGEEDRDRRARLLALVSDLAPDHLDRIERWMRDPRWYVVRNAVCVIERAGGRPQLDLIRSVLDHDHPRVRQEALRALTTIAGSDAVRELRELAFDDDEDVRLAAVHALAAISSTVAAQVLADAAKADGSFERRRGAIDELARHPAEEARALLARLADDVALPRRLRRHARSYLE